MPKVTQQISGKGQLRSQHQTQWLPIQGSSHSSILLPQPRGTFIYRIRFAKREVPEFSAAYCILELVLLEVR